MEEEKAAVEVMPQPMPIITMIETNLNDTFVDDEPNQEVANASSQQEMTREEEIQSIIDTLTEEIAQT